MPIQVRTNYRAEMMVTEVFVYQVEAELRQVLTGSGTWVDAGQQGLEVLPTYRVPDNVLPQLVNALGVPMSDAHLVDALRHERTRVDNLLGTLAEAVTRGL